MHSEPGKTKSNSKVFLKSKKFDAIVVSEAVDVVSSTSFSSFGEAMARKKAGTFEKVNSWLNRGQDGSSSNDHGVCCTIDSKYCPNSLDYPFIPNKIQSLLCYGEYSLFTKWIVAVEGDFVQIRFNASKRSELVKGSAFSAAEVTSLKVQKKKKCSLREIRTLALTKNWLLICNMQRIYHVEKDLILPTGIILQLRRLVPLKYLKVTVSRSAQRVISIANRNGIAKEYQLIEESAADKSFCKLFEKWQTAINNLKPNHDDERLLLTMQMYERWTQQHSCRITLRCESRESVDKSASDLNRKKSKRPAPPPPPPPPIESVKPSAQEDPQDSLLLNRLPATVPVQEKLPVRKHIDKNIPQVSSKNFQLCSKENSLPSKSRNSSRSLFRRQKKNKKAKSVSTEDEEEKDPSFSAPLTPTMTETTFSDLVSGCEASIGPSDSMVYGHTSEPVAGIEASVGMSRPITPDDDLQYANESESSIGDKRPRRSVKDVFKMGLFLSKRNKKKNNLAPPTRTLESETRRSPEPPLARQMKRRTSRLEMGIPIEEVFSGVEFATLDPKPMTFRKSEGESELIEDPDEFVAVEKRIPPHPLHDDGEDYLSYESDHPETRENVASRHSRDHDARLNASCVNDDLT